MDSHPYTNNYCIVDMMGKKELVEDSHFLSRKGHQYIRLSVQSENYMEFVYKKGPLGLLNGTSQYLAPNTLRNKHF